ncbi:MAG: Asp-tRNA(Asn)/Glu-tRNA(Gln) amidotransferase subunit GatC [Deltaproteobacteria bacterium]|nr:Asp-tRNA(Asn)/Glu-tRNA(Gln) amidotransferase subunit GatC [Candidatus Zymogenaceae bacterium]
MADHKQKITADEVGYVAKLARLALSDNEAKGFTDILNDILAYMDKLSEIDTADIEPMTHAIPNTNVMRDDIVVPSEDPAGIIGNAPDTKGTLLRVPKVIE